MSIQSLFFPSPGRGVSIKLAPVTVSAGWPSPAQDYYDEDLDLNSHLIHNPSSTVIVRVAGNSMICAGIAHGDELIVDRSLTAKEGDIVIAVYAGELTVKRLTFDHNGTVILKAENPQYPDIRITPLMELQIWGVVKVCIHYV